MEKSVALHFHKIEFFLPDDALCQVWTGGSGENSVYDNNTTQHEDEVKLQWLTQWVFDLENQATAS